MTTNDKAEELQETTSLDDELEVDPSQEGTARSEEAHADGGEQQTATAEEPVKEEPKKDEPKLGGKTSEEKLRDSFSRVRNDQVQGFRLLKALEEDGVYTREEMAEKSGIPLGEVNRLLDHKPTAQMGEPEYHQTLFTAFEQDVKNPVVLNALEKAYGGKEKLNELKDAYAWAHRVDPTVAAQLDTVTPDEIATHIFDVGQQYLEEFLEAKAEGLSPLEMVRRAKAQAKAPKQEKEDEKPKKVEPSPRDPKRAVETMPTLTPKTKVETDGVKDWMDRLKR